MAAYQLLSLPSSNATSGCAELLISCNDGRHSSLHCTSSSSRFPLLNHPPQTPLLRTVLRARKSKAERAASSTAQKLHPESLAPTSSSPRKAQSSKRKVKEGSLLYEGTADFEFEHGYSMGQVCDRLLEVFLVEKTEEDEWWKLLLLSDDWNKIRPHFFKRCKYKEDLETDKVKKDNLLSLSQKLQKISYSILQQTKKSWAMHICFHQKCISKKVNRDMSTLKVVQVAFNNLIKQALRFYLCCKNLQSQLREQEILKSSAGHDWLKLIPSLHQNLKRKTVIVILGSVMAGILLTVGAPATSLNPVTWALTEENLIFLEAWRTIDRAYIDKTFNGQSWFRYREEALKHEPMNNREQTYAAIRKMLMTLEDPFTRFLEPEKFNTLRTGTRGAVTGVGLEVGFDSSGANANLVVIAPVIGGPAERAGIVPGDIIREIDGIATNGLGLYDAAQRLQGPESSEVKLTVHKKESGSPNTILLVREKIKINPVSWRLCEVVEDGKDSVRIGYIRLATFNENASRSIKEAIQKLKESGATAFILDMRNNSGGLFPAGVEIAKMWLEKGVIVYITDSTGIRDIYEADGYGTLATNERLAVLVNKGTASASEILAGALKDNKRATILGEPTFGKGKIQSVFELSDGSGMAVTVARYETPAHVDIDKVGILPDHSLPTSIPLDKEDFCRCLIDSSLPCHMPPSTFFPN